MSLLRLLYVFIYNPVELAIQGTRPDQFHSTASLTITCSIDDVIHRIILYTINNGVLTGVASIVDMICVSPFEPCFIASSLTSCPGCRYAS